MKPEAVKVGKLWWIRQRAELTNQYEWLSMWNTWQWYIADCPRRGEHRYFRSREGANKCIAKLFKGYEK